MRSISPSSRSLLLVALALAAAGCRTGVDDWSELDDSVIRLVVEVDGGMATGSAFAINDEGIYVSNHHVVAPALAGQGQLVAMESATPLKTHHAEVIWSSEARDLAILRVAEWRREPMAVSGQGSLSKNMQVVSLGFPGASDELTRGQIGQWFVEPKAKAGVISAIARGTGWPGQSDPIDIIEHDAVISGGNSGGPLVDLCGRVVGVNTAGVSQVGVSGTFFASAGSALIKSLNDQGVSFDINDETCLADTPVEVVIQWSVFAVLGSFAIAAGWVVWLARQRVPAGQPLTMRDVRGVAKEVVTRRSVKPSPAPGRAGQLIFGPDGKPVRVGALALRASGDGGAIYPLEESLGRIIGRDIAYCDIPAPNEYVSRQHCTVTATGGAVLVQALPDTSNGTQVDGSTVDESGLHAKPGQTISLAGQFEFMVIETGGS